MRSPSTGSARPATWLALLAVLGAGLHLMGAGDLATPPADSLDALTTWAEDGDAATTAMALVRIIAELAVWYLLVTSLLQLAAVRSRSRGVGRIADAVAVPGSRRLVHAGLGVGLLAATAAGTDPAPTPGSTAWMQPRAEVDETLPDTSEQATPAGADAGTASMTPRSAPPTTPTDADADADATPEVPNASTTWRVDRGESFWSIASDVLSDAWGRPATDLEIDPFWRSLVAHNRDRLLDPDDPDVIMTGQVFELPMAQLNGDGSRPRLPAGGPPG